MVRVSSLSITWRCIYACAGILTFFAEGEFLGGTETLWGMLCEVLVSVIEDAVEG